MLADGSKPLQLYARNKAADDTNAREMEALATPLRTLLDANPQVTSLTMLRWSIEGGLADVSVDTKTDRYVTGFAGELGGRVDSRRLFSGTFAERR